MKTDLQILKYRQSLVKYALRRGVTSAARRYHTNRQYIYRWMNRYDGTLDSLANHSRRPHHHPNEHTAEEIKLIKDMRRRNPKDGLVVFWVKLMKRGYTRHISSLYRVMKKFDVKLNPKKKRKTKAKKYIQMTYPGERLQIDTKNVPSSCLPHKQKLYQFTAIDEFTRLRYIYFYDDKSSYSANEFLKRVLDYFPFPIKEIRTDNGMEYTKRLSNEITPTPTLFEQTLKKHEINHDYIKPFTPKHNGKVERSHRKDNERFYQDRSFIDLNDLRGEGQKYLRSYNNFPMGPHNWLSPLEFYGFYLTKSILTLSVFR
uniref:Integrase core domain protein n=1 Tax=Firmicutes bacterium enrichment culture clone fosmid MGS-M2 TaxID=1549349 RepID=A0A0B5KBS4_9FIRM|nr:integrase core domain protein [Firmicutes bacterium enrichment culture clone fosmid MGS-M2]